MALLEVRDLAVRFGGVVALDHVTFSVEAGQVVGLIGPNGAGKTTLFNIITRVYRPSAGSVTVDGLAVTQMAPHEVIRHGVARTFQNLALFRSMTVLENVLVGDHIKTRSGWLEASVPLPSALNAETASKKRALEALDFVGISQLAGHPVATLPFGTQKRVERARALVSKPRLLLLDEPAGGISHEEADGAGKTTTLRAITGGVPWLGEIRFAGRSLRRMPTEDIVRGGIAHVPEGRGILTELTVDENLRLGEHTRKDRAAVRKDYDRVFEYFPVLRERRRLSASTLSGGEQQMLAVGRALLMKPRLMLLDEPSLGLAPIVVRSIFEIIRSINQTSHVAVLLVEQNARIALELSSTAYVLEVGRVAVSGKSAELQGQESVRRSYLGY